MDIPTDLTSATSALLQAERLVRSRQHTLVEQGKHAGEDATLKSLRQAHAQAADRLTELVAQQRNKVEGLLA
eukprot:m.40728 g.40728  ORF g.40728 m.40728 type:complete len:72 (+) comp12774_c0_seq6:121-336(+)